MSTNDIVQGYYDRLNKKGNGWQELWSEDASFSDASRSLDAQGKEAVIQSFTPFLKGVESVSVKQIIAEGENACVIAHYHYVNPKGENLEQDVAEVWKVKGNQLAKLVIYFDLTAYRTFMRG